MNVNQRRMEIIDSELGTMVTALEKFAEWSERARKDSAPPFEKQFEPLGQPNWSMPFDGCTSVFSNKDQSIVMHEADAACVLKLLGQARSMKLQVEACQRVSNRREPRKRRATRQPGRKPAKITPEV